MMRWAVWIGLALAGVGCGLNKAVPAANETAASEAPRVDNASTPPRVKTAVKAGAIHGAVSFHGRVPVMPSIDFSSNPQCARAHLKPLKTETVAVNRNGTLRNAFVWIKSGLEPAHYLTPAASARLDQVGCVYQPHVLGLMVGQELAVANGDNVNHDVHIESVVNAASNEAEPPRSETIHRRFAREEVWFPVTCGLHPWMRSYVGVVSHPYFAVTGSDGSFALDNVPPGEFIVEAIQEEMGRTSRRVHVVEGRTAAVRFEYPLS